MNQHDWTAYIAQMEQILNLDLNEVRRAEIVVHITRIADIAAPLMDFLLDERLEVSGVYHA